MNRITARLALMCVTGKSLAAVKLRKYCHKQTQDESEEIKQIPKSLPV